MEVDILVIIAISFVSTIIGSIIASVALMRYLSRIGALEYDAINKHRTEVRKNAAEKLRRKHR